MHPDLKFAGVLPPLDAPHHLRASEWGPYREGVVRSSDPASGSLIDVGLDKVGAQAGRCTAGERRDCRRAAEALLPGPSALPARPA